ncbi:hypothetical protein BABINDRAFT_13958 [Babjeviella inositovora NRRL Y-12698]|uniref:Type 1 phosphatases regulator n=1 Tax=Babjeviella inositovora NRRL Y-12698 TaxID=984486 RepID=A0A1E3QPU2_9ASCO|nr:uncharacterized protein BABINDRAFT_13958 [Babjeviella inositovora NRRL Y-12698]ODQ79658.1 hypothetical protein BABINDRAFT_13958 [Babjeviella inositovora NRRL Y-12698]
MNSSFGSTTQTAAVGSSTETRLRLVAEGASTNSAIKDGTKKKGKKPKVKWQEGVVDNEHLNRKKSKICCIFHPNDPDAEACELSDSGSSSLSSESDSNNEGSERKDRAKKCQHKHKRSPSPNAYEKQPVYKNRSTENNRIEEVNRAFTQ